MKNIIALLLGFGVAVSLAASEGNLLKNGNFEKGDQYWKNAGEAGNYVPPVNGEVGFKIVAVRKGSDGQIIQSVKVVPGKKYRFSGEMKSSRNDIAYFQLKDLVGRELKASHTVKASTPEWQMFSREFTVQGNRLDVICRFKQNPGLEGATGAFRNLKLEETSAPDVATQIAPEKPAAAKLLQISYVAPSGTGERTGVDPANACDSVARAWELTAPGGTVFVAAGRYSNESLVITAENGGSEGKTKKLVGMKGENGYPVFSADWKRETPSVGRDFILLQPGASHIEIDGLRVEDYRNGVMGRGTNNNLAFHNLDFSRVRNGIYLNGGNHIEIGNCSMTGFTKRGVRLQGGVSNARVHNVLADAGGKEFATERFQMCFGIGDATKTVDSDILLENCVARNAYDDAGEKYWNADGFCAEANTQRITWKNCQAFDCTDGGWDFKTRDAVLENCAAFRNKRNFRVWGNAELRNCIGGYAHKRGGSGTEAGLHVCGNGGKVKAVNCTFIGNAIAVDADQKGEAILENCLIAPATASAVNSTAEDAAKVTGFETCRILSPEETGKEFPEGVKWNGEGHAVNAPAGEKAGYRN